MTRRGRSAGWRTSSSRPAGSSRRPSRPASPGSSAGSSCFDSTTDAGAECGNGITFCLCGAYHTGKPKPKRGGLAYCGMMIERIMSDETLHDRLAIRDVVESWVIARDSADWERFRAQWHEGGYMTATWFQAPR